jgi:hypothetical protein
MRIAISGILLSMLLAGGAMAQTSGSAPAPAATAPAAPSAATDKKAISKSCTDQANAKGLHGKARKKFRSDCKKNGGKAS